jgi:DNA polymerase-4
LTSKFPCIFFNDYLAKQLMQGVEFHSHPIRLLGLGVSNQKNATAQEQQPWVELELEFEPWPEA